MPSAVDLSDVPDALASPRERQRRRGLTQWRNAKKDLLKYGCEEPAVEPRALQDMAQRGAVLVIDDAPPPTMGNIAAPHRGVQNNVNDVDYACFSVAFYNHLLGGDQEHPTALFHQKHILCASVLRGEVDVADLQVKLQELEELANAGDRDVEQWAELVYSGFMEVLGAASVSWAAGDGLLDACDAKTDMQLNMRRLRAFIIMSIAGAYWVGVRWRGHKPTEVASRIAVLSRT